jgi:N-acyl-D-amino-acid deacylase
VQEGGYPEWAKRLQDPAIRERVKREMVTPTDKWESLYLAAGSPDKVLLIAFKNPKLKLYTGKTLAEVAKLRGKSPEETAMDLVIEDGSRVGTVYFMMSEDNVRKQIRLPWMSFGSDRRSLGAARRLSQIESAPARLRQLSRDCSADTCATRKSFRSKKPCAA